MNDLWDASPCYMYGSEATSNVRQVPSQSPIFPIVVQSKSFVKALFSHRKWLWSHTYSIGRHPMNRSPDFWRQMFNDLMVFATIANEGLAWFWTCSKKSITVTSTCPITREKMISPYIDKAKVAKPQSSLMWLLMKSLKRPILARCFLLCLLNSHLHLPTRFP